MLRICVKCFAIYGEKSMNIDKCIECGNKDLRIVKNFTIVNGRFHGEYELTEYEKEMLKIE